MALEEHFGITVSPTFHSMNFKSATLLCRPKCRYITSSVFRTFLQFHWIFTPWLRMVLKSQHDGCYSQSTKLQWWL